MGVGYVLVLALVALEVPLGVSLGDRVGAEVRSQAEQQADLVSATAVDLLPHRSRGRLDRVVVTAGHSLRGRVIVVDAAGQVLADSAGPATLGTSYASRPEVAGALTGKRDQVMRASRTLRTDVLATAAPLIRDGRVVGAVRITQNIADVRNATRRVLLELAGLGVLVLALGLVAGVVIARRIAGPVRRLDATARQLAGGDLDARVAVEGSTEQRSLAHAFNEMADRLGRLLRAQREFVADSSHQLRTPLAGLRLRLEEARHAETRAAAAREIAAAEAEARRLAHIIDELLVLSRAGERELPGESLDLAVVAQDAVERWQPAAHAAGHTLEAIAQDARTAWIARADLDRALDSLIENAIAYAAPGTPIAVVATRGGVEVRDEGPGLAPGEEREVFERFHRGRAGRAGPPGTGLGLAIARELTREWNGDVVLARRPGGGTVARILVPARGPLPSADLALGAG